MTPSGFLISGNDDFEIKKAAQQFIQNWQNEHPDFEIEIIEDNGENGSLNSLFKLLLDTLNSPSLFSSNRLIWVKNCPYFANLSEDNNSKNTQKSKNKGKNNKSEPITLSSQEEFLELLKSGLPEDIVICIDAVGIDRRTAFYKACNSSNFSIQWFDKVDPSDRKFNLLIRNKIKSELEKANVPCTVDAIEFLCETMGSDSSRISSEIEKLSCYAIGKSKINRKDCIEVCSHTSETVSWALTDALMNKDLHSALQTIDDLCTQMQADPKSSEIGLLSIISTAFQNLIKTKVALRCLKINEQSVHPGTFNNIDENLKSNNKENFLLGMHPYRAYILSKNASQFSDLELVHAIRSILQINKEMVSGAENTRTCLERLIFSIICK